MAMLDARCWPEYDLALVLLPNVDSVKIRLTAKATPVKYILTSSIYRMSSDDHDQTSP
jgi:hypothetical protein